MLQLDRFPIRQVLLGRPRSKFVQQRGVSFLGVLRLPALMAQVLQKIFDQILHGSKCGKSIPVCECLPT
jgi:hypothetical protein